MKIGLISNRRSRRNQRKLAALEIFAPQGVEILHRRLEGIEGLGQGARDRRDLGLLLWAQRLVAVAAGPGEVEIVKHAQSRDSVFPRGT